MKTPLKIAIADDHDLIREGLKKLLSDSDEFQIIAEASNGQTIVELSKKIQPDVYLMDIKMPRLDGIQATKKILGDNKRAKVLAISFMDNDYAIVDMLEAGASGYIVKNADKSEISIALRSIAQGKPYFCEYSTPTLLQLIASSKFNPFTLKLEDPLFDDKERKIIQFLCEGKTSQQIANKLFLSCRTIEGYRLGILKKMGVRNTAGIILYAIKTGLYRL